MTFKNYDEQRKFYYNKRQNEQMTKQIEYEKTMFSDTISKYQHLFEKHCTEIKKLERKSKLSYNLRPFWVNVFYDCKISEAFMLDFIDMFYEIDKNFRFGLRESYIGQMLRYQSITSKIVKKLEENKIEYPGGNYYGVKQSYYSSLSENKKLKEEVIFDCSDKLDWNAVVSYNTLSEKILEKFIDKIDTSNLVSCQKLTIDFIKRHLNIFDKNALLKSYKYSHNEKEKIKQVFKFYGDLI
jgi:hypothetical protein